MEKKLLAYMRQSKKGNSDDSISVQEKAIRAFVQARSLPEIEGVFKEEASAKTGMGEEEGSTTRGVFKELIDLLKEDSNRTEKKYAGIIFFDISRISRNASDFVVIENFMKQGYRMYSVRENIVDSPAGLYFFRMAQIEAIYYSERQSSKIRMYRYHKIKSDSYAWTGGQSPAYGYMVKLKKPREQKVAEEDQNNGIEIQNDDEYESIDGYENLFGKTSKVLLHPINSKIVRRIFELAKDGTPHASIYTKLLLEFRGKVDTFNENPKNADWTEALIPNASSISEILHNDNEFRYNGRRIVGFNVKFEEDANMLNMSGDLIGGKSLKKGDDNEIEVFVPDLRIVDDDLYKIAMDKMERRILFKESRTRDFDKVPLFGALIACSCGAPITGQAAGKGFWYACSSSRQKDKPNRCPFQQKYHEQNIIDFLDREIFQHLQIVSVEDQLLDEYIREQGVRLRKSIGEAQAHLTNYIHELQRLESGEWTAEQMKLGAKRQDKLKNELIPKKEAELGRRMQELKSLREGRVKDRIEWLRKSLPRFKSLSRLDQKSLIDLAIKSIVMGEIHDGKHLYKNMNGISGDVVRQQKIVESITFNGPFQKILTYNRYPNNLG